MRGLVKTAVFLERAKNTAFFFSLKCYLLLRVIYSMRQTSHHLPVSERIGGVRPEGEFGTENGLSLQTRTLPNE